MQPFELSPHIAKLVEPYAAASEVARISRMGGHETREFLARLWLSEGIPFAFRAKPAVYDAMRSWLARRLGISPKEITMVGSARLGQSLDPNQLGKEFSSNSDLDLTIVSPELFQRIATEFSIWKQDFENGLVKPNRHEEKYWRDNADSGPKKITRGFLDANMIPHRDAYVLSRQIGDAMWRVRERLKATPNAPKIRKADVRVYRNWEDFTRQVVLSLECL